MLNRRQWLTAGAAVVTGACLAEPLASRAAATSPGDFRFCLNTATIRGQNLSLEKELEVAARAGYQAIEPWIDRVRQFAESGGSLSDLRQRIQDLGLTVEGAIGFPAWMVDDEAQRSKALEQVKSDMDLLARIGGKRMAAPPAGVPREQTITVERMAERYRRVLELGQNAGVVPVLEFWGGNHVLGKLSTTASVAIEAGHPQACVLADIYHMYRGGSSFDGLRQLSAFALPIIHMNDYPAHPPREQLNDGHRIFPGDGAAPVVEILRTCRALGAAPVLSLELFNRDYWRQDALEVARNGLAKMKAVVAAAFQH